MLISRFPNDNIEERIIELENKFDISLPKQYRKFICQYNGGYTPNTDLKVGRASTSVRAFYGFGGVDYSFDKLNIQEWIKDKIFPVACDMFGNEIAISLDEVDYGCVYFLDHEKGYMKSLVGTDFKAFVQKCKSKEINPLVRRSIEEREADLISRGRGHVINDLLRQMWQEEIDKYANMVQEKVVIK